MSAPAKTHCPAGHRYTPLNSFQNGKYTCCRTCKSAFNRRYRLAHGQPLIRAPKPVSSSTSAKRVPTVAERPQARARSVRSLVAEWAGRSLCVHHANELRRVMAVLEANEPHLYALSPHAPRLLDNLRRALASPAR